MLPAVFSTDEMVIFKPFFNWNLFSFETSSLSFYHSPSIQRFFKKSGYQVLPQSIDWIASRSVWFFCVLSFSFFGCCDGRAIPVCCPVGRLIFRIFPLISIWKNDLYNFFFFLFIFSRKYVPDFFSFLFFFETSPPSRLLSLL